MFIVTEYAALMQVKSIAECSRGAFCNTLTNIKLPFVIKIFILSIFEWPFYTGFTVHVYFCLFIICWLFNLISEATGSFPNSTVPSLHSVLGVQPTAGTWDSAHRGYLGFLIHEPRHVISNNVAF